MTSSIVDRVAHAAVAFAVVACVVPPSAYAQGADAFDPRLQPTVRQLLEEGDRNFVLNHMRLGVQAMELGQFEVAERSFDQVIANITSIYADNERAAKARSLWYEEGSKEFRGEPYERSMAFYYRGLLDLIGGDYENARASFRSGVIQDAFAEEEQNQADFASLIFLDGWASHLAGDKGMAEEAFTEAKGFRPDMPVPAAGDNVLIVAESGPSPRKLADGIGHNILVYRRGKRFTEYRARLVADGGAQQLYPIEDVFWQAMTRGGRPVDGILEGQVKFRNTMGGIGSALTDIAAAGTESSLANTGSGSGTANVVGAVGIIAMAFAAKAKAQADTRYWDNLPDLVHVETVELAPGTQPDWTVQYLDQAGRPIPGSERPVEVHWDDRGNGIVWVRSHYSVEP